MYLKNMPQFELENCPLCKNNLSSYLEKEWGEKEDFMIDCPHCNKPLHIKVQREPIFVCYPKED